MTKRIRLIALLLVCSMLLVIPANATAAVEPRESEFFMAYSVFLEKTGTTTFQVWFDVTSNVTTMDELGTSVIHVYRSADGDTWTKVRTYNKENYSAMISENAFTHTGHVDYTGAWSGYYYRAAVTLYAKEGNSVGEKTRYTEIIRM